LSRVQAEVIQKSNAFAKVFLRLMRSWRDYCTESATVAAITVGKRGYRGGYYQHHGGNCKSD
jgi:hypothetical protein